MLDISLQKFFTEKEKEEIIYKYTVEKVSSKKLGQMYGCSDTTLMKNLKNWGIPPNERKLNLAGKAFGELVAIKPVDIQKDRYPRWVCKCSCGKIVEVRTEYLTSGHTKSCGHIKDIYFNRDDLIGKRFSNLVVIENVYESSDKICVCDCGNIVKVKTSNLKNGNTRSCGCVKSQL